jgi:IS605 OrfB family transposase
MNHIMTSIRLDLQSVGPEADTLLHERLMRPQRAAMRVAYNRLVEGVDSKTIWHAGRDRFRTLTGRSINDAILSAQAVLRSQRERLPEQVRSLDARIKRTEEKLARELGRPDGPRPERVQVMRRRMKHLAETRDALQVHIANNTVPPAMFGGRRLWAKVQRGVPAARAEWRGRRTDQFFSRGANNCGGNAHCRLVVGEDSALRLAVRVSDDPAERGGRATTRARWLTFNVRYSRQYEPALRRAAEDGAARQGQYTVRLLRLSPGQYRAYVTLEEPVAHREYAVGEPMPAWCARIGGVDLNLDHLAAAVTDRQGQFGARRAFEFANLGELPRSKTRWQIGNIVRDVIQWLQDQGVQALVIEDLDIRRNGGSARYQRRTVPFAYRQLTQALVRRALRAGMVVKRVNPAYTSWIGRLKYVGQYGVSVHLAAAYVIARRGLGLEERIPKHVLGKFPAVVEVIQKEVADLERRLAGQEQGGKENQRLVRQLERRHEWVRRLTVWKSCSPEAGRPWLLWVTLYSVSREVSGVRDVLFGGDTYGRK